MKIDGKKIADEVLQELRIRVQNLQNQGITPHLVVILIGESPASVAYVKQKEKKGAEIGAIVTVLRYDTSVKTYELAKKIKELNTDPYVHAILVQRPVPNHIDIEKLVLLTDPQKDIDGFHPEASFILPIPLAVMRILMEIFYSSSDQRESRSLERDYKPVLNSASLRSNNNEFQSWLKTKNLLIFGKGPTGGGPVIEYFTALKFPFKIIDSKTPNTEELMKKADIIIAAVGRENIIKPEMLKKGVILIGVGISRGEDGKLHGDYDEEQIKEIASYYTPTPGGVGPVNVAMLMDNLITAAEKQTRNE